MPYSSRRLVLAPASWGHCHLAEWSPGHSIPALGDTPASSEAKQERKVIATAQEAQGCLYNPMGPRQGALKLGY